MFPQGNIQYRCRSGLLPGDQLLDQVYRPVSSNVEAIVNDLSGGIDDDFPGGAARTISSHDGRRLTGFRFSGGMRHGDFETVLQLVGAEFVRGIGAVALEYRLDGQKHDLVVALECLCQFFESWEPHLLTPRSPILKKIEVNDLAAIVAKMDGGHFCPSAVDPGVQIQLRGLASENAVV